MILVKSNIKHYVTFLSPGTFVSESSRKEIPSWDVKVALEMSEKIVERYNATPYGFRFETWLEVDPVSDGENTFKVQSENTKSSGVHFIGGNLKTYDQLVIDKNSNSIFLSNMRCNDWWVVCENTNSFKSTLPFCESDFIVNPLGRGNDGLIIEDGSSLKWKQYRESCRAKYKL